MGKKKNKRNQPTTNPFWSNIHKKAPNTNLTAIPKATGLSGTFQAPHHQPDSLMDLTDDTSPNNPMSTVKGNPGNQSNQSTSNIASQPIFDTTDDVKEGFYADVTFDPSGDKNNTGSTTQADSQSNKTAQESNKGVVQGSPSSIKLMVNSSKNVKEATQSTSNVNEATQSTSNEKAKPIILSSQTVKPQFSVPTSTPNIPIKKSPLIAVPPKKVPDPKPLGEIYVINNHQINNRITRAVRPITLLPQQYIAPTPSVFQPILLPQSPILQRNNRLPAPLLYHSYPKDVSLLSLLVSLELVKKYSQASGSFRPNAPKNSRPNAPQNSRPNAPQNSRPNAPQNSGPEAPGSSRPEAPESSRPEAPESSRPEAPESSRPDSPESARPDSPESARPDSPESARPDSPESGPGEKLAQAEDPCRRPRKRRRGKKRKRSGKPRNNREKAKKTTEPAEPGIPKSFLVNQNQHTPEPYSSNSSAPVTQPTQAQSFSSQATLDPNAQQWAPQPKAPVPNVIEYAYNYNPTSNKGYKETGPLYVQTETKTEVADDKSVYSPSDVYADNLLGTSLNDEGATEEQATYGSESPDLCEPGQKRLSAFKRLGPVTQPKKPKLTINLLCNKDQSVREVVDETEEVEEEKYVPVHLRPEITMSTDEIVMKYIKHWPWKKPVQVRKTVTARNSKSVMILEHEQMSEIYDKNNVFIQITVTGYPPTWKKEKVLDILLDTVNGKIFVPCFIEFAPQECKFLVMRCRTALAVFHRLGFIIHRDGHELQISISHTELTLNQLDFIPKNVLKKVLVSGHSGERSLDLSDFTTKEDISHFIYYPLNRINNQMDIVHVQSTVAWEYLTDINLSHNRLTSIEGFNLPSITPRLKFLDLSYNCIEKATLLIKCRSLSLRTIKLEGNPLCNDYTDPERYVKVLKLMFPTLIEIDGIPIKLPGEIPSFKNNYCPEAATEVIEKFLEVYFPILDSVDDRELIRELYHERACMTITTRYKLRYSPVFRSFRTLFHRARVPDEGAFDAVEGARDIAKLAAKWPALEHDPFTFRVDVLMHDDFVTIFKIGGLVRLTAETLAEDEHLLAFSRTFVLHSFDGAEYKIANEMVYWDEPTDEYAHTAFRTAVKPKRLSLKLDTPDEDLKKQLLEIFMRLTDTDKSTSEKCLEQKEWNLKSALEYFMKLLKLDDLENLTKEIKA
ncbi:uncharacterized protein LOC114361139 isoform X1 [Ostrinia furnacalis]|uniref:uncharacterized protein LOC114361139 isoform X1 n=1 Tax=Ostrinia furnacalis TaxID=93504 RepID=UPI00103C2237|nr:uncharacterized protein LOC114361139 isoform X1 [Ostrinia furnacalis]